VEKPTVCCYTAGWPSSRAASPGNCYQAGLRLPFLYLVNFVPAVLILAADGGVVVQQELAAARVSSHHHAVIKWRQTAAVLVVWRGSQLQQRLRGEQVCKGKR